MPIETKFANLTMQIRALLSTEGSTSGVPTLLTTASLYAFNCSYFTRCDQCLSAHLGGGCVWCATNAKCVFNTRLDSGEARNNFFAHDYEETSCPNELDRMESTSVCTSFVLNATNTATTSQLHSIQIPYSAESSISRFTQLSIGSEQHNYPLKFRCFFTKSGDARLQLLGSSELTWTGEVNALNRRVYDCTCSPHLIQGMRADVAAQSVYLSVWWTTSQTLLDDDELVHNLTGWNQIRSAETNAALDLFAADDLLNKKDFIRVDILNCDMKASSCGACMEKELIDLGCGWCRSSSTCSMKKDCGADWISQLGLSGGINSYCADPSVEVMSPRCGPAQSGGTQLILTGTNLGFTHNDVKVRLRPSTDLNDDNN